MFLFFVILVVVFLGYCVIVNKKNENNREVVSVWFGLPGAGKSTFAAWLVKRDRKKNKKVYSNVPITGALKLDPPKDIGKFMISEGRVIIDEAGVEYNNRNYKNMSPEAIHFYKYHRHYQCPVDVFSQDHEDMDITLRRLAQRMYHIKKSFFPWFVIRRTIGKKIDIDPNTKQLISAFYWVPFSTKYIFCPPLWKTFNTISRKELPEKEWETW